MKRARPILLSEAEQAFDVGAWVDDNLGVVERSGREWLCVCPRCGGEKFAVNVSRKAFQCWHCDLAGWSPRRLVEEVVGWGKAEEVLARYNRDTLAVTRPPQYAQIPDNRDIGPTRILPTAPIPPGTLWRLEGHEAAYAHHRGIPSDHAYWFGLSSIRPVPDAPINPTTGRRWTADSLMANRLLFPVWAGGRVVQWVGRACGHDEIKTVNLPASCEDPERHGDDCTCKHDAWGLSPVPKVAGTSEVLLGAHLLKRGQRVIIVEGPVDAAVCGPGFVATQGARLSIEQAFLLMAMEPTEVVLCYDGDEAGYKATRAAHELLAPLVPRVIAAQCPDQQDPGKLGRAGTVDWIAQAGQTSTLRLAGEIKHRARMPLKAPHPIIPKI